MEITEKDYYENKNIIQTYKVEDGIFSAEIKIYANFEYDWNYPNIIETEIVYYVNNKRTINDGFKILFIDLYGRNSFNEYENKIEDLAKTMFKSNKSKYIK